MNGTDGLFAMIYAGIGQGEPRQIAGERCFLLEPDAFVRVLGYAFATGREFVQDGRIAAEGYENFEVTFGVTEKHRYFLVSKMPGLLDTLWEKKKGPK